MSRSERLQELVYDWLGDQEWWVTPLLSAVIVVRYGFLAYALTWVMMLTVSFSTQNRIWEAQP